MSVTYREQFCVGTSTFGIEDYEQRGDHFFPDLPHKRFHLWRNGCGIGQADTIDEARKIIHIYVVSHFRAARAGHRERMQEAERILGSLGDDPFNLGRFKTGDRLG